MNPALLILGTPPWFDAPEEALHGLAAVGPGIADHWVKKL